jgi:uncharacterized protein DUF3179
MPFPGSQEIETIRAAYFLERITPAARIAGILFLAGPVLYSFFYGALKKRIAHALWILILTLLYHFTDSVFSAQVMFREPLEKKFENSSLNKVPLKNLVIGIENNGSGKAYPINFLGYHHKVQDTVGGMPVLVTYCTMCRTGRVYSPLVNGKHQQFRLVGARHYNAVIEDAGTKTWWYQATGEAAAGPLKGTFLRELPFEQMTLQAWLQKYPDSEIMQRDSNFSDEYTDLEEYDRKLRADPDSSWQRKSWVIGIIVDGDARAYDWKDVLKQKLINDSEYKEPVLIFMKNDNYSFSVWSRKINGNEILFEKDSLPDNFKDVLSHSLWNSNGECTDGFYKGKKLYPLQAYQEYWHAWKHFHPNTSQWKN